MLWIMLPRVTTGANVAIGYITVDIRVADEIVVVVDIDVIVTAAPTTVPAPASAPCGTHCDADSKRYRHAGGVIARRRVVDGGVRIDGRTINYRRIVCGHINHFRTGLLDYDDLLVFYNLGLNFLLLAGFQVSSVLRLLAHSLDCIHHIALLGKEGIPEVRCPLDVFR